MAGIFDQSTVNQVQQANDIVDVISEHVNLVKKGTEMVGLCPFHEDHRPSMYVNTNKQIFKCFACGAGGDVFKFVQMRENLTFPQAIERLAERARIKINSSRYARPKTQNQSEEVDPNKLAKVNEWAADFFQKNLQDKEKGKAARDYLAERKINPESIKKWRIGLASSSATDMVNAAKEKRIPPKFLVQAGLVVKKHAGFDLADKFVNRLMFTITDVTGRVIGFGGRTLDGNNAKYVNSPSTVLFDKSNSLFGLEQARHNIVSSDTAIVVEGYTDCIMAHQFGIANVVAALGTSFTTGHGRMLKRYAKKVILIFDSDIAGVSAANRALEVCLSQRIDIKLASVPEGKDPCDFILAAGKERFEKVTEEAVDVFKFKWNRLNEQLGSDETIQGQKAAIDEFLQTIATAIHAGNLSAIDRGLIVNRLSKLIALDSKEINAELGKRLARTNRNASYHLQNSKVRSVKLPANLSETAQREILEVLLNEPELFDSVQIANIVFETLDRQPNEPVTSILRKVESVDVGNLIADLAQKGQDKGNFAARLKDAVNVMRRCYGQSEKKESMTIKDKSEFLRDLCKNARKENPHNIGMR